MIVKCDVMTAEYFWNFLAWHCHMSNLLRPSISDIILKSQYHILLVIDCIIWGYSIMFVMQSKFHILIEHSKMLKVTFWPFHYTLSDGRKNCIILFNFWSVHKQQSKCQHWKSGCSVLICVWLQETHSYIVEKGFLLF